MKKIKIYLKKRNKSNLFLFFLMFVVLLQVQMSSASAQETNSSPENTKISVYASSIKTENIAANARLVDSRFFSWGTEIRPSSDGISYTNTATNSTIPCPSWYTKELWIPKAKLSVENARYTDNNYMVMRPSGPTWDPHVYSNGPDTPIVNMRLYVTFDIKSALAEEGLSFSPDYIKGIEIRTTTGIRMAGHMPLDMYLSIQAKSGGNVGDWVNTAPTALTKADGEPVPMFSDIGSVQVSAGNNDLTGGWNEYLKARYQMFYDSASGTIKDYFRTKEDGSINLRYSMSCFSVKYPGGSEFWKVRNFPCMMEYSAWIMDSSSIVVEYSRGKIGELAQNPFFSGLIDALNVMFDPAVVGTTMLILYVLIAILIVGGLSFLTGRFFTKSINKRKKFGASLAFIGFFLLAFIIFSIWAVSTGFIILDYPWELISRGMGRGIFTQITGIMMPLVMGVVTVISQTSFKKTIGEVQMAALNPTAQQVQKAPGVI